MKRLLTIGMCAALAAAGNSAARAQGFRACPGDLDQDGRVDLYDLSAVLEALGQSAAGDIDGDADTDIGDLNIVLDDFRRPDCTPDSVRYERGVIAWRAAARVAEPMPFPDRAEYAARIARAPIPGDVNEDGVVNWTDVGMVRRWFGSPSGDVDGDGMTGLSDLGFVLSHVATQQPCEGDLDRDGRVSVSDLAIVIGAFATSRSGDIDGDAWTGRADLEVILARYGDSCE
jgi:hypothetical protein